MIDQCIPDNEWYAGRPAFGRSAHWLSINTLADIIVDSQVDQYLGT